jgi:polysaccharide export outer membrane protein
MINQLFRLLLVGILGWHVSGMAQPTNSPKPKADTEKKDYLLNPDDVLQMKVYQEEDMDAKVTVDKQGMVNLPMLGSVKVAGLSVEAAAKVIRDLYAKDYLVNPQVSLNLFEAGKRRFSVIGQVQRPGTFDYPVDQPVNLLQALSMAGGLTRLGSPTKVLVSRLENGETKIYQVNAEVLAKERNPKPFEIMPNDVINVGAKLF